MTSPPNLGASPDASTGAPIVAKGANIVEFWNGVRRERIEEGDVRPPSGTANPPPWIGRGLGLGGGDGSVWNVSQARGPDSVTVASPPPPRRTRRHDHPPTLPRSKGEGVFLSDEEGLPFKEGRVPSPGEVQGYLFCESVSFL